MKIEILTHDFNTYETEVESYDPVELNDKLNDADLNTVVIGNLIFSRINVKSVAPVVENEEATE